MAHLQRIPACPGMTCVVLKRRPAHIDVIMMMRGSTALMVQRQAGVLRIAKLAIAGDVQGIGTFVIKR